MEAQKVVFHLTAEELNDPDWKIVTMLSVIIGTGYLKTMHRFVANLWKKSLNSSLAKLLEWFYHSKNLHRLVVIFTREPLMRSLISVHSQIAEMQIVMISTLSILFFFRTHLSVSLLRNMTKSRGSVIIADIYAHEARPSHRIVRPLVHCFPALLIVGFSPSGHLSEHCTQPWNFVPFRKHNVPCN